MWRQFGPRLLARLDLLRNARAKTKARPKMPCPSLRTLLRSSPSKPPNTRLQVNLGPCVTLNVLKVVDLKYCNSNGQSDQQSQQTDNDHDIIFGGDGQISFGGGDSHISISGVSQSININSQTQEAIIEQKSKSLSWKSIWNYNTGVIATKVPQQNACYISVMNRTEMPSFDSLVKVAAQGGNLVSLGRPARKLTFVTSGSVNNLNSYGANTIAMCSGLTTYRAYEVQGECKQINSVSLSPGTFFPLGNDYCTSGPLPTPDGQKARASG
ncbi:PREDICTED: gastrokine-1-like [Lepidothrix coronata]|uniref:Gastrokine-1-like n=1 Tax=Lepidothrix coronata TaxID=321398 RepID=A0A6J0J3L2_9PASS|nr:PREDICTED: gastrokine-1-like [Lepidothrix coronata]